MMAKTDFLSTQTDNVNTCISGKQLTKFDNLQMI